MTYHRTAQGLAALGRNGDSTLMHVNPREIEGLQQLLGPVTINPNTGLPEAFNWTDILSSAAIGILGAMTGGAAAAAMPAMGAIGGAAVGAGTGALVGGGLSAAQGRGFGPGALGGAISGGLGGFGGTDLPGGATAAPTVPSTSGMPMPATAISNTTAPLDALAKEGFKAPATTALNPAFPASPAPIATAAPPSTWDTFTSGLGKQGSAMLTKEGAESLIKPVGMGALLGSTATNMVESANTTATQMRQEKLAKQRAADEEAQYFAGLGFPLNSLSEIDPNNPASQRDYYMNIITPPQGRAAGGPITARREIDGVPVQSVFPVKYVSEFNKADLQAELPQALDDFQKGASNAFSAGFATGGYANTQPIDPQNFYPQSEMAHAQPYPAATPMRHEMVQGYEKGGFLDGPGDGMSDDIPANIDGKEEVRLADGEFVIPPEIVRMIGDGDPERGARLLDQLLPMVRQAAHGKKEQVKQNAGKLAAEKFIKRAVNRGDNAGHSGIQAAG